MPRKIDSTLLPYVTQIRHEFTNYDRLTTFYQYYKHQRTKLNGVIFALVEGKIDIPTFKERVKEIEDFVDLTKKENQKRFLKTEMDRLNKISFYPLPDKTLKQYAKHNLSQMLHGKLVAKGVS